MKRTRMVLLVILGALSLATCKTAATTAVGAAAGAGIGSVTGDTKTGAIVGGSAGLLIGVF